LPRTPFSLLFFSPCCCLTTDPVCEVYPPPPIGPATKCPLNPFLARLAVVAVPQPLLAPLRGARTEVLTLSHSQGNAKEFFPVFPLFCAPPPGPCQGLPLFPLLSSSFGRPQEPPSLVFNFLISGKSLTPGADLQDAGGCDPQSYPRPPPAPPTCLAPNPGIAVLSSFNTFPLLVWFGHR